MNRWGWIPALLLVAYATCRADPPTAPTPATVELRGNIDENTDLSGVGVVGPFLVLASDETRHVQLLRRQGEDRIWEVTGQPVVLRDQGDEIDIEAIAVAGKRVYVLGSHSLSRKKVEADKSYEKNRSRIDKVSKDPNRFHLFAFDLDPETGKVGPVGSTTLSKTLEADPILARFTKIPSKENGIDLEGLAVRGEQLYVGFRSPVLRQNNVPVLKTTFADPTRYELAFVDLDGLGIRDLLALPTGILILAGPPADAPGEYALFYWTGEDALEGSGNPQPERIATLDTPEGGNPEGIALIERAGSCHTLLVIFDGISGGAPRFEEACVPGE